MALAAHPQFGWAVTTSCTWAFARTTTSSFSSSLVTAYDNASQIHFDHNYSHIDTMLTTATPYTTMATSTSGFLQAPAPAWTATHLLA
eukprot:6095558-Amphidinium_carterae.1